MAAPDMVQLETLLLNVSGKVPLHERFKALFTLKNLATPQAIQIISKGFTDDSALLKHELAFCLGQTHDPTALPTLESVLSDKSQDPMVRHEAAEAIGAISQPSSLALLKQYLNDNDINVRETCEIAVAKIEWDNSEEGKREKERKKAGEVDPFGNTIDPAPALSTRSPIASAASASPASASVPQLRAQLLDTSQPLFERYRAMFGLRNVGTDEAVEALAEGFGDKSALFRHEIAFVFGQLSSPHSVPPLIRVLNDEKEHEMVRHEAAEALGGIATPEMPEVVENLRKWCGQGPRVVRESCIVAMAEYDYMNDPNAFQPLDGVSLATASEVAAA